MALSDKDLQDLKQAKRMLETPGLAARITDVLGTPVEKAMDYLPAKWSGAVAKQTQAAIKAALSVAVSSLDEEHEGKAANLAHKFLCGLSGAVGGAFGLPALAVELPVSTVIMLRSIADIARAEGENVTSLDAQLACVEVFALGGTSPEDDAAETGYFATRAALAKAVTDAAKYIAKRGLADAGAPPMVRLISQVATRYGVAVSEKAAAQAVPVVGGVMGGTINVLFVSHFQKMAQGHFAVRRLERKYGADAVRLAWDAI